MGQITAGDQLRGPGDLENRMDDQARREPGQDEGHEESEKRDADIGPAQRARGRVGLSLVDQETKVALDDAAVAEGHHKEVPRFSAWTAQVGPSRLTRQ